MKVRDVIQIYRVFNNLRDSGEDSYDQIKLYKLLSFPFFDQKDYEQVEKRAERIPIKAPYYSEAIH